MSEILIDTYKGYGIITLNRPEALNALSLEMLLLLTQKLQEWEIDPFIHTILIKSASDKAFSAGGDVKLVAKDTNIARQRNSKAEFAAKFFRAEYSLNALIANLKKPYISFINGIVMGGGAGISIHGSYRIVNNGTKFAMPEVKIGFFPDIGSGNFLKNLAGYLGLYLSMTGTIITGHDMASVGLATHFTEDLELKDIFEDILEAENADMILDKYKSKISKYKYQLEIDKYFSKNSVEEIIEALEKDKEQSKWCSDTYDTLLNACPTSLKVAFKHFYKAKELNDIKDIVKMDYRLAQNLSMRTDFYEGVRAVLIDKTNDAKWYPNSIYDVKDTDVDIFFGKALNGEKDLLL